MPDANDPRERLLQPRVTRRELEQLVRRLPACALDDPDGRVRVDANSLAELTQVVLALADRLRALTHAWMVEQRAALQRFNGEATWRESGWPRPGGVGENELH